ncbi:MAG: hypothetical protein NT062_33675 [Proteobacteria bacterium]|nr:hypothetical protein [Pseudomonadota bacterium]
MTRETKDRARPFSRKHRKYWLPVTGGMILIGVFNVCLGMCTYDPPSDVHTQIQLVIPRSTMGSQTDLLLDAGVAPLPPSRAR